MSDSWHFTRLRFNGHDGIAKLHGHVVPLSRLPQLPGIDDLWATEIDYIPEVHLQRIKPLGEPWRDMEDREVRAADQLLWDMAAV